MKTPLMFALEKKQWAAAEKLMEAPGIQLEVTSSRGDTALSLAKAYGRAQLAEKIEQKLHLGATQSVLRGGPNSSR